MTHGDAIFSNYLTRAHHMKTHKSPSPTVTRHPRNLRRPDQALLPLECPPRPESAVAIHEGPRDRGRAEFLPATVPPDLHARAECHGAHAFSGFHEQALSENVGKFDDLARQAVLNPIRQDDAKGLDDFEDHRKSTSGVSVSTGGGSVISRRRRPE